MRITSTTRKRHWLTSRPATLVSIIGLVVVVGCRPTSDGNAPRGTTSTPQSAAPGGIAVSDLVVDVVTREFVDTAAAGGRAEVELAQLAQRKAAADRVHELARIIEADHARGNDELRRIGVRLNMTPDETLKPEHQQLMQRLEALDGAAFDRAYTNAMREEHRKDIQAFTRGAQLDHPDVRAFAERTLPTLRAHLEHAEAAVSGGQPSTGDGRGSASR